MGTRSDLRGDDCDRRNRTYAAVFDQRLPAGAVGCGCRCDCGTGGDHMDPAALHGYALGDGRAASWTGRSAGFYYGRADWKLVIRRCPYTTFTTQPCSDSTLWVETSITVR